VNKANVFVSSGWVNRENYTGDTVIIHIILYFWFHYQYADSLFQVRLL